MDTQKNIDIKNALGKNNAFSIKDIKDRIIIGLFILILITPMLAMEFRISPVVNYENRTLAPRPTSFNPYEFEAYLNDNFSFKNTLVAIGSAYKSFLGTSASSQVVRGKEGWLFYSCPDLTESDPIATYMGLNRFSENQLLFLQNKFETFDQKLREQGIDFYLLIPPNKHTIYAEMLPDNIRENAGETRMNQLIRCLKDRTNIKIIDVTTPLIQGRLEHQLYYKTDTHWNSYGAYIAYAEILRSLNIQPYGSDDYEIIPKEVNAMDMARMAGTVDAIDQGYDFVLKNKSSEPELIEGSFDSESLAVYTNHDPISPSLMIFHDSYNVALMPFLTPHFNRTISYWTLHPNVKEIIEQAPDYVIFEILERNLECLFDNECLVVD